MINNDNIIIQRIRSGETWEFGLSVNSYGSALMAFVGRIVDQQEDAEDIVQNTFVAAYEHLKESYRNASGRACTRILLNVGFIHGLKPEKIRGISCGLTYKYEHQGERELWDGQMAVYQYSEPPY